MFLFDFTFVGSYPQRRTLQDHPKGVSIPAPLLTSFRIFRHCLVPVQGIETPLPPEVGGGGPPIPQRIAWHLRASERGSSSGNGSFRDRRREVVALRCRHHNQGDVARRSHASSRTKTIAMAVGTIAMEVWKDVEERPMAVAALLLVLGLAMTASYAVASHFVGSTMRRRKLKDIPKAPGGLPILGHGITLLRQTPWDLFAKWVLEISPIIRFNIFGEQFVVVAEPKFLKSIWQSNIRAYTKDMTFTYKPFLPLLGTGLVTSEGELWRKQRLLVSTVFRIDILEEIVGMAKRAVDRFSLQLEKVRNTKETVDLEEMFRRLALQVIGEALMGLTPQECDDVFPELYLPIMEEANKRVLRPWRMYIPSWTHVEFSRNVTALDKYIVGLVRKRRHLRKQEVEQCGKTAATRKFDILDRVLDHLGEEWSLDVEKQLTYELKTFVLAGHETSSAMLTWALYQLAYDPDKLQKVREEARAVGLSSAPATEDGVSEEELAFIDNAVRVEGGLDYTLCVLKETLRKYSVVPAVTRLCTMDTDLCGYKIPKGTHIICLLQATHHLEQFWPNPMEFKPERFQEALADPFSFVPFIQGPRNCLGQHLALREASIVLAQLAARFNFTPAQKDEVRPHPWIVPVGPANGMPVFVT